MPSDEIEQIEPDISVQEDIEYQKKGWTIQQVASYLIFGLTILIASGLFGNGPLSNVETKQGQVTLSYERFLHKMGSTQADIRLQQVDSITIVELPLSYLTCFLIESVVPKPLENHISGDKMVYRFKTSQTGHVIFQTSSRIIGAYRDTIRVNGTSLAFSHFTYP